MSIVLVCLLCLVAFPACERKPVSDMGAYMTVITGGTALVGPDLRRIDDAVVVIRNHKIEAIGVSGSIDRPAGADVVDATGLTLVPGFIDTHVHIAFADPHELVANGVTTARDLAWIPNQIWSLVRRSQSDGFDGPRLLAAGQMLTVQGGYPSRAGWAPGGAARIVASGEARAAVTDQVRMGASAIKVALNAEVGPTLPERLLRDIVTEAHAQGLPVTAHTTGLKELRKALATRVDELAHMLMSEERIPQTMIREMVDAGMTVVPTLSVRFGSDQDVAIDNVRRFLEAGGRVVYGTDLGNAGPRPGIDAREIAALIKCGMDGRSIIASGTVDAASHLDLDGIGVLAVGMEADIVAVRGDPLQSPADLTNVQMVWRGGRRVR